MLILGRVSRQEEKARGDWRAKLISNLLPGAKPWHPAPVCTRGALDFRVSALIAEALGAYFDPALAAEYRPRWNIAPSKDRQLWAAIQTKNRREIRNFSWGIPLRTGRPTCARRESLRNFPPWRDAFNSSSGRVVVPFSAYYEWTGAQGAKQPHLFTLATERGHQHPRLLLCAALHILGHVAILTVESGPEVKSVHARMPVLLHMSQLSSWLEGSPSAAESVLARPMVAHGLRHRHVDPQMNRPSFEGPQCFAPPRQATLF